MGISDTFKKLVGIEEVEDDFDDEELEAEKERISRESVRKPQIEYKAPKAMGRQLKGEETCDNKFRKDRNRNGEKNL